MKSTKNYIDLKKTIPKWLQEQSISFSKEKFKESFDYVVENNRPFFTLPIKKSGQPAIIKILLLPKDCFFKSSLSNEARVYQFLPNIFNKKLATFAGLPHLIEELTDNDPLPYFIREDIGGKLAGKAFQYKRGSLNREKIRKVLLMLQKINQTSPSIFQLYKNKISLKTWGDEIFRNLLRNLPPDIKKKINLSKLQGVFEKAFSRPIASPSLIHGDVIPGNIIIQNSNVFLIDWEKMSLGSPFYDCGSLFASLWSEPILQKEALKEMIRINNKIIKKRKSEFQFLIVYYLIRMYLVCPNSLVIPRRISEILEREKYA